MGEMSKAEWILHETISPNLPPSAFRLTKRYANFDRSACCNLGGLGRRQHCPLKAV